MIYIWICIINIILVKRMKLKYIRATPELVIVKSCCQIGEYAIYSPFVLL